LLIADEPGELKELTMQGVIPGPPARTALLRLLRGYGLRGELGVVSVLRADLDVGVTDDPAIMDGRLRNLQVPVG
jgi:hypothetical protein